MISVSNAYKEVMSRPVRNRSYISVGIGIINQNDKKMVKPVVHLHIGVMEMFLI